MLWLKLGGYSQTRANFQHALTPNSYWVLCTPGKTSEHRLKVSAGIRNLMLFSAELQAPQCVTQPSRFGYPKPYTVCQPPLSESFSTSD